MENNNPSGKKKASQNHQRKAREGKAWSVDEEQQLYNGFSQQSDIRDLSIQHARAEGGIRSRLKILGLLNETDQIVRPKPQFRPSRMSLSRTSIEKPGSTAFGSDAWVDTLFLRLLHQLPMERRAIVLEIMRGLVALSEPESVEVTALRKLLLSKSNMSKSEQA